MWARLCLCEQARALEWQETAFVIVTVLLTVAVIGMVSHAYEGL